MSGSIRLVRAAGLRAAAGFLAAVGSVGAQATEADRPALLDTAARVWHETGHREAVERWVRVRLRAARSLGVKAGVPHDTRARYAIPMQWKVPRLLVVGVGSQGHKGLQHHCFDFLTRVGDPVVAARPGTVLAVVDGHPNGVEPYDADRSNAVLVKHADESLGLYLHLSPGIPVAAGDAVQRRQLIGRSGHSGAGSREHLHFCVHRFDAEGEPESVPILFGPPRSRGFVPRTGRFYGPELVPTENLRIRAAGATADPDRPAPLAAGASVQLKVELRNNGAWRDVTRDPATRYEPLTLWNLKHAGAGRLVAEPTEGFAGMEIAEPLASLLVLYEQDGFRERGKVTFTIE